jgi:hypothetical protein
LVKTASFTFNAHKSRSLGEQFFSDLPADYGLFSSLSLNWRKLGAIGDPDSHPSEQGSLGTPNCPRGELLATPGQHPESYLLLDCRVARSFFALLKRSRR